MRVIPREVQIDPVTETPIHADFQRLVAGARLRLFIPVHFNNHGDSPGLKRGGVLNIVRHEIEFFCPSERIPQFIEADLAGMDIGDSLHISKIKLPEGIVPVIRNRDFTVATVAAPSAFAEVETKTAAAAEGDAAAAAAPVLLVPRPQQVLLRPLPAARRPPPVRKRLLQPVRRRPLPVAKRPQAEARTRSKKARRLSVHSITVARHSLAAVRALERPVAETRKCDRCCSSSGSAIRARPIGTTATISGSWRRTRLRRRMASDRRACAFAGMAREGVLKGRTARRRR